MKMEEWKEYKLGDIYEVHNGLSKGGKFFGSGYPFLSFSTIFNNWFIPNELSNLVQTTDKEQESYSIKEGDVFITRTSETADELGMSCVALKDYPKATYNGFCKRMRQYNHDIEVFPKYIGYYLRNPDFRLHFQAFSGSMSTRASLTNEALLGLTVKLPPLPTQQKIAAILSSLDDKIELNNKINTNLEQQAQALFKNRFVDFEPFGGKMPEGWKVGKLSEYCNFQEGYVNPAQTHNEYFDGDVKWLRAVDINESFIINTSRTLTKCGFESAGKSAFLFKPGSIAISKSGTVGRLGIISDFMCGNRAVIGIELKEQQNLSYIHQYLKSRQTEFPDMAVGSVQKNLYVSILENLDIIIPSKDVLEKYARICMPFYDQIKTNCIENNNLCSIRDTLLPKLMNVEIEV